MLYENQYAKISKYYTYSFQTLHKKLCLKIDINRRYEKREKYGEKLASVLNENKYANFRPQAFVEAQNETKH